MALDTNQVNRILGAARARDVSKVEELWIDLQSSDGAMEDLNVFLQVANEVGSRGDKDKAAELMLLLKEDLKSAGREEELFDLLRRAVSFSRRVSGIREELLVQYRRKYADRPGLEGILSATDLAGEGQLDEAVRRLDEAFSFQVGDFVFHGRGWGVGKVVEARPETGEFVIDFSRRRGQRMEAGMALSALERRGADDLDVLLWTDKERVRELASSDPLALLRMALVASGGKLQSRDLRSKLADVLDKSAWTKFWGKARKLAKNDPQIEVGRAPRSVISLRDKPLSREEEVAHNIKRAPSFKARLALVRQELIALRKDAGDGAPSWLPQALKAMATGQGKKGTPQQRAAQLELALLKTELNDAWPEAIEDVEAVSAEAEVDPETGEPLPRPVAAHELAALEGLHAELLPRVLHGMSTSTFRKRSIELLVARDPQTALPLLEAVLLDPAPQVWNAAVAALKELGRDDVVVQAVTKTLIKPHDHPDALAAFARARLTGAIDILPGRSDAEILVKTLQVYDTITLRFKGTTDKQEKASLKSTVELLRSLLNEKSQRVMGLVLEKASEDEVRRVLQIVRQSTTVTQTIKRATEKFIVKRFPELLATVATTRVEESEEETLFSTPEGKRRRERDLIEIMDVKMPQITIEIGKALEFGDISENSELDAARETQQRLAEQAERIQKDLERVVLIDPERVQTDQVHVGTRVEVENLDTQATETYTILGPWDVDERDPTVISHLSALATGLLGLRVGDTVGIKLPGGDTSRYTVRSIERAVLQET